MTAIVLDASVAVKLVSEEPESDAALDRVGAATRIIAPDWMLLEVTHALWKKAHQSRADEAVANAGVQALKQIVDTFFPAEDLLPTALSLSFALQHPVYDCLYLALAQAEGAMVVTADEKFARAAIQHGQGSHTELLVS
ncbi:type II toxin-antitoxin system VapC family toxin [Sphingomonas sp. H39-1-10]|uniref:type II toxin-antitoxin system VapC family toxin n=1 Tax=Sphingomonas TaxID=13687 RepID=UPI00088D02A9|nr:MULTISPECIES: type II toxin-antitoxin system VapC family toxin [Sphingomonas]MDF0489366.1 type II toxin-antitoxin system VapC family toxin [Sphingomonas pollutisoli]SDA29791.1 Predicted nucleic acid-binding protein, contains PIN domain [Sphingomonas sp. NFR15]